MSSRDPSAAYEAVLRELQVDFIALLPERVDEMRSALTLLASDPAARTTLRRLGHRIGGTAATVGLDDVGRLGRAIEEYLNARDALGLDDVRRLEGVVALLDEWTREALRGAGLPATALLGDPRLAAITSRGAAP